MSYRPDLLQPLMEVGFTRQENIRFASGQSANNKLELDYEALSNHPELLRNVVHGISDIAEFYEPEFVVGVPNGATGIANKVARELNTRQDNEVFPVYLKKDDTTKRMRYTTQVDEDIVQQLTRGIVIEDVLNRRTNTQELLKVKDLGEKVLAVVAVFDRGLPKERLPLRVSNRSVSTHSLVTHPIKPKLRRWSRTWRYAR